MEISRLLAERMHDGNSLLESPMFTEVSPAEFIEAEVMMFPDAESSRSGRLTPREGNYLPMLRSTEGEQVHVRVIDGPATLGAGDGAIVVMEVLAPVHTLRDGDEFTLVEHGVDVAIGRVVRAWRRR